jgi:hypothetical protein
VPPTDRSARSGLCVGRGGLPSPLRGMEPFDHDQPTGRVAIVNSAREVLFYEGTGWPQVRRRFQSIMCVPHPDLMHHRSIFEEHGFFDLSFRIAGDYEMLLREHCMLQHIME